MDDLNMEEFQSVLDQVIDFSLPESKKSPLVQKLNQDAKEDNCLEAKFLGAAMFDNPQKQTKFKPNASLNKRSSKLANAGGLIGYESKCGEPTGRESHLQKLENFCDSFEANCTLAGSRLTSVTNCSNLWDSKRPTNAQLNGTLASKATESSPDSFISFANSSATNELQSSQQAIHNHQNASPENSNQCCDNLNCDTCKQPRSKPIYVSSAADELGFEMKDYSRRAKLVEYSSNHPFLSYADLKEPNSEANCDEAKLVKSFKAENYSNSLESSSYYDHSIDQGNRFETRYSDRSVWGDA